VFLRNIIIQTLDFKQKYLPNCENVDIYFCFCFFQTTYEGLDEVLILEDDARFEPYFRFKLQMVLNELRRLKVSWDLVYV